MPESQELPLQKRPLIIVIINDSTVGPRYLWGIPIEHFRLREFTSLFAKLTRNVRVPPVEKRFIIIFHRYSFYSSCFFLSSIVKELQNLIL